MLNLEVPLKFLFIFILIYPSHKKNIKLSKERYVKKLAISLGLNENKNNNYNIYRNIFNFIIIR